MARKVMKKSSKKGAKAVVTAKKPPKKEAIPRLTGATTQKQALIPPKRPPKRPMAVEPRVGVIAPEEFEAALRDALGGRGWQKTFIRGMGIAQSTLTRYLRGVSPYRSTWR